MEDLKALINIISQQKVEKIDLFNSNVKLPFKTRLLYDGILKGSINNENEAILALYDDLDDKPKFKKLESRLKSKLLNTLFFIDLKRDEFIEMRRAQHQVVREFILMKIIHDRNESKLALNIALKTFTKAQKYELTEYALHIARYIHHYYSIQNPSKSKRDFFNKEIEALKNTFDAEMLIVKYYNDFSYLYLTKKAKFDKTDLSKMKSTIEELSKHKNEVFSLKFRKDYYNLVTSYYIFINDFTNAIQYCEEALAFFESKPYDDRASKFTFRNSLIMASIGQRNYTVTDRYIAENYNLVDSESFNWYRLSNYKFLSLSSQQRYQELYILILDVTNSSNYKNYVTQQEFWKVIEAYMHFLIRMKKVDPQLEKSDRRLRPFSLARFLNELPKFSQDKRGLNVSILIIQFLFLLLDKKYSTLIDRLDAIKQYSYRHLKNDETYRSNLFIKMLLKVADADFNPIATERYTQDMLKKLLVSHPNANLQSVEIEIVQYEKIWELIMEMLVNNKKK